ncbi:MAG: 50S ribosomal protein L10 [Acidobacteria bacterium]|nr:MAG: 50S ribosomal protein L10 [Acidobacteriota bacterium]REK07146.1 MAG: 50S ribosomal protein L10 [Acidobacteriota bacterium]
MTITRQAKEQLLQDYSEGISTAPHAFLVGFQGIKVHQVDELRRRVRASGGRYQVVKNRIALRAIDGVALADAASQFNGPTAVAYSTDDPVALAKALTDFNKENPVLQFKGGVLNGQPVAAGDIEAIASLPSREELIAKLVFMLQSPIARFVRGLGAIPQQFVSVLDQVRQQKEQQA